MVIDHIGVVVRSLEKGIAQWSAMFGYRPLTQPVLNTRQRVRVVFLEKKGSPMIKLVEAADETSVVHQFAQRGGGLHHLCFRCDDLPAHVASLQEMGARLLNAPEPGEAFGGDEIAFLFAGGGLNIEVIATDHKAERIPCV